MTEDQANAVYDLLVESAGAPEGERGYFVFHATGDGLTEYRFQGWLGFGGKLYVERRRWRVGCYPEDETPGRRSIIDHVNGKLAELRDRPVAA